jgi:Zn-dependent protease with chaperone function
MTDEKFSALVDRLEAQALRNPARYKSKVLVLAALGNLYLGAILLVILALLAALAASALVLKALAVKLILVIGVFLWVVLEALWIRLPPPQGTELRAQEAPELFAIINDFSRRLRAPRFHHVLVTDEFNAGVVQAPRLGPFGWYRNYLLLGLPFMKALTVEQFKAVLAHEYGHLARGHGRLSNWIYRQRLRWWRLMEALDGQESRGRFLFRPFLRWYAPYFNAFSFPLARANEYEADAASVRLTSVRSAAEALTSVNVIGNYLSERYWPQVHRQADEVPQPSSFAPYSAMGGGLGSGIDEVSARGWLDRALARETGIDDTHPALSDRLKAIEGQPALSPPAPGQAADRLLGSALAPITEGFDQRWRESIQPSWEERHQEVREGRRRLAELDQASTSAELPLAEAYERARLAESIGDDAEGALEQFRMLQARAPDDPTIAYSLGARLLERDDGAGVALVERAMALDEDAIVAGSNALRDYHWRQGREEEAREWHKRAVVRAELEEGARKDREEVRLRDKFDRHALPAEALAAVQAALRAVPGLRKAYLARKRVKHLSERTCFVLGFTVALPFWLHSKKRAAEVQQAILQTVRFPGETLVINVEGENYRFGRKFRWMRGSRIV